MICHYRLYCTLQSFFWAWALLSTPHRPIVKSFKGSEAAALSLSVVRTTTAHYLLRNTIFVSSTLIITRRRSNTELPQSRHDSNGSLLKCFPRHRLYKREIVCSFKEKEKKGDTPTKNCPIAAANFPLQLSQQQTGLFADAEMWLPETGFHHSWLKFEFRILMPTFLKDLLLSNPRKASILAPLQCSLIHSRPQSGWEEPLYW